jgi:predicted dehydrogenase
MDLGCYPVHWVRTVMGSEPDVVSASAEQSFDGVDETMRATLDFGGIVADIECSMADGLPTDRHAWLFIDGSLGRIVVDNPLSPHTRHELVVETADGKTVETVDGDTTYWHQLDHMRRVIGGEATPLTGGDDAINNMQVIDNIYRTAGMLPRGMSD